MREVNSVLQNLKMSSRIVDELFILSIRRIAENVLMREMKNGKEIKTIAIISPFNNEGKSKISSHLANEFAALGFKTLLISFQRTFDLESEIKVPQQPYKLPEDSIVKTETENLDYLSSNDIRRAYGFTVERTSLCNLLNRLKGRYNRIIIDTGALEKDLSGFTAANAADGVYFICCRKNIRKWQVEKYYKDLKDIGVSILGIIYNNAEKRIVEKIYIQNGERHG